MFFVFPSAEAIASYLSQELYQKIQLNPCMVLGLATGSTMEPLYADLAKRLQQQPLDLSQLTTFNLDEYIKLPPEHPQSYAYYMRQHLFDVLGLCPQQAHLPNGVCTDIQAECRAYSAKISAAGGLDYQLLGIGTNGHIGFNEPLTPFDSLTHVVQLSENTRLDNGRFFDNFADVPTHAITLGIQDILNAKEIVLVATGAHKAQVMADLFHSPIDESMPASALKQHPNIRICIDDAAAAQIPADQLQHVRE